MTLFRLPILLLSLLVALLGVACRSKDSRRLDPTAPAEQESGPQQKTAQEKQADSTAPQVVPASPQASPEAVPRIDHTKGDIRILDGESLKAKIRASGAKATVVNAWASWCGPCRREFPMLVALRESLSAQKVELLFVSVDEEDSHQAAIDFASSRGVQTPLLVAARPLSAFKAAMSPQWPGMLPATFLFDASGELRYFWPGEVFESELTPIIEGFLAGKDIDGFARVGLQRGTDSRK